MEHPAPARLVAVFVALLALLLVSVGAAFVPIGPWSPVVALAMAAAKSALVIAYFMQLGRQPPLLRVFALGGFLWLGILFLLTFADVLTRGIPAP
jgi:cytochrome c oxidase subunit 4